MGPIDLHKFFNNHAAIDFGKKLTPSNLAAAYGIPFRGHSQGNFSAITDEYSVKFIVGPNITCKVSTSDFYVSQHVRTDEFGISKSVPAIEPIVEFLKEWQKKADQFPSADDVIGAIDSDTSEFSLDSNIEITGTGKLSVQYTLSIGKTYERVTSTAKSAVAVAKRFDVSKMNERMATAKRHDDYYAAVKINDATANTLVRSIPGLSVKHATDNAVCFLVDIPAEKMAQFVEFVASIK